MPRQDREGEEGHVVRAHRVDLYGFFHVVGEGCEGDLGDHLHDLLVGVAYLTYPIESFVGGVSPTLDDLLDKAEGKASERPTTGGGGCGLSGPLGVSSSGSRNGRRYPDRQPKDPNR
ncbi:MAG TPA: hypothetical protein VK357_13910 [Rubrobacteraceae bacterium]|nr:hypothetical protein [Rubrobacteraceae bacterium]